MLETSRECSPDAGLSGSGRCAHAVCFYGRGPSLQLISMLQIQLTCIGICLCKGWLGVCRWLFLGFGHDFVFRLLSWFTFYLRYASLETKFQSDLLMRSMHPCGFACLVCCLDWQSFWLAWDLLADSRKQGFLHSIALGFAPVVFQVSALLCKGMQKACSVLTFSRR